MAVVKSRFLITILAATVAIRFFDMNQREKSKSKRKQTGEEMKNFLYPHLHVSLVIIIIVVVVVGRRSVGRSVTIIIHIVVI